MTATRTEILAADTIRPQTREPEPVELICSEVWGGNREAYAEVKMPGVTGFIYSHPCDGTRGGDVHYLSTCSAGLLSRVCLADVAGHGQVVARVSGWLHQLLRKHMSAPDPRRILQGLNEQFAKEKFATMTTAACLSYYAPAGEIVYCYAGHPPAWLYRRADDAWTELPLGRGNPEALPDTPEDAISNLPLGIQGNTAFERATASVQPGDRLFLFSDGVLEARDENHKLFGEDRLRRCLTEHRHATVPELARAILDSLFDYAGANPLTHDDVTMVLLEIGERPRGPMMYTMMKNQFRKLFTRRRK